MDNEKLKLELSYKEKCKLLNRRIIGLSLKLKDDEKKYKETIGKLKREKFALANELKVFKKKFPVEKKQSENTETDNIIKGLKKINKTLNKSVESHRKNYTKLYNDYLKVCSDYNKLVKSYNNNVDKITDLIKNIIPELLSNAYNSKIIIFNSKIKSIVEMDIETIKNQIDYDNIKITTYINEL